MYWSDVINGSLNRAFLNGTNAEVLLRTEDPVIGEINFVRFVLVSTFCGHKITDENIRKM